MAGKVRVDLAYAYRLLHPMHVVLVSCVGREGRPNIITLAWAMPASHNPPLLVVSISPRRYSHGLIQETGEFVVNIPTMEIVRETLLCGRISGRQYDKFKEAKLTPMPAKLVKPPIIRECVAHLECRVENQVTAGDHTLFIGRILTAYAEEGIFDREYDLRKVRLVYHLGEDDFTTLVPEVVTPEIGR